MTVGPLTGRQGSDAASTRALVAAFVAAAAASAGLWWGSLALRGERIDLESVLPLVGDSVTGPGSGGSADSGTAGLVLLAVAVVAGLPLLAPAGVRRQVAQVAAVAVSVFAVATLLRNGVLYLPAAGLLWWALRPRASVPPG